VSLSSFPDARQGILRRVSGRGGGLGDTNRMDYTIVMLALAAGLFLGIVLLLELGRRLGKRRLERDSESARSGVALAEGAVFGLLGLLIAFSFSGAAERFQERRELITAEANAIGTAWLRLDLMPPDTQPAMRERMRSYVDSRLAVYRAVHDDAAFSDAIARVSTEQAELWRGAISARGQSDQGWDKLVLPALNDMFDVAGKRTHAFRWHPPAIIFMLLCALGLGCALLAGFAMASAPRRPLVHMLAFAAVVSVTVYVILDLEFPRQGLLRVDDDDQVLVELRDGMR
jgi:hypothetical protein